MPTKLKKSISHYNRKTKKTTVEHFFIKQIDTKVLLENLSNDSTNPKIKQKIRNELIRRHKLGLVEIS